MRIHLSRAWLFRLTCLISFIHAYTYWMQESVLPFRIKTLDGKELLHGQIGAFSAFLQVIGSPIMGRLCDLLGIRALLLLSEVMTVASSLIIAKTDSIRFLFISRIPYIFIYNVQGTQKMATDLTLDEDRLRAFSQLGFFRTLGLILGNVVGGILMQRFDDKTPVYVAAVTTLVNFALVMQLRNLPPLPQPNPIEERSSEEMVQPLYFIRERHNRTSTTSSELAENATTIEIFCFVSRSPSTRLLFFLNVLILLSTEVLHSSLVTVAINHFNAEPVEIGLAVASMSLVSMVMQGAILPVASLLLSEVQILRLSILCIFACFIAVAFATRAMELYVLSVIVEGSCSPFSLAITSLLTKIIPADSTGTVLGINMSLSNLISIVAPICGSLLVANWGFNSIGYLGMGLLSLALISW